MTSFSRRISIRQTALAIAGLNFFLIVTAWLFLAGRIPDLFPDFVPFVISSVVYSLLAMLILSRHPLHIIGWLFVVISFMAVQGLFLSLIEEGTQVDPDELPAIFIFLGELTWIIALFAPLTLVLQFFPDGQLPSRRWWPVPVVTVLAMLGLAAGFALSGVAQAKEFLKPLGVLESIFMVFAILGSLAAVVVRFLRSRGAERLQMKWLVYTAGVGIILMLLFSILLDEDNPFLGFFTMSLPILLAVTVAVAILRYRLYNIDIIIRRTLQYTIITAVLALIYFGLVVILQALFAAVGDIQSPIFIVLSTLVIAGLFNPVRIRVQNAVDRRFYRQKYRAEQALAQFAVAARDEVDLDRLAAVLLDVVEETMRPERASLTLFVKKKE